MARISVQQVGKVGVVRDLAPHLLPLEAWTGSNNVRFQDKKIARMLGERAVFGTPTVAPQFTIPVLTPSEIFWPYFSLTKAYVWDGTTHTNITRTVGGDYSAAAGRFWNGGIFGGVLVVTNETDVPQYWPTISAGTPLANLANWPATLRCRIIRPFKAFLVALNLTSAGTVFPHRVRWSHNADPGTVPTSWDITDLTKNAGEVDLSDTQSGEIKEALQLGDSLVIYKTNSTWVMRFIGGSDIFRFDSVLVSSGILAARCVCAIKKGSKHFLHNGFELVEFDGQNAKPVMDDRWARFLRSDLDSTNPEVSFCVDVPLTNEAWFCYPTSGSTVSNRALIWNYEEDTIYTRDFQGVYAATGPLEESLATIWDSAVGVWDDYVGTWSAAQGNRTIVCDPANTRFLSLEDTEEFAGVAYTSYIEKLGMSLVGVDRFGNPVVDIGSRKMLKRIWPKITGGPVHIIFAKQENLSAPVVYDSPIAFNPANGDEYVDSVANGRLVGFRIEEVDGRPWGCEGYEFELEVLGEH